MADEVEVATLGTLSGLFRRTHPHVPPSGAVCENCATLLRGSWCYACGQEYGETRRSIADLVCEAFEGLFHADGRLWRTLPRLMLNPAQLTADYVQGKRAPQAPPFSLFLVMVVLFVFISGATEKHAAAPATAGSSGSAALIAGAAPSVDDSPLYAWIKARERVALSQPERFSMVADTWEHRLAIVMLPISALLLTAMFAFNRRFLVHDHLVFSMHSFAFAGLVIAASMLAGVFVGDWAMWLWLLLPVHLFFHMRGFYQTSAGGTLARMGLLYGVSAICFVFLMFALILISLSAMTA